eukprot:CAMPEP_0119040022 /NCGR_PEP_ID=MMETSP1177-20130426/9823_1 /TAXON_ID=2985 /ORGANISM="Ochromonas sp, Strain CCMP1899" /LENGTH=577 /DNA_ID=CAMNT_0007004667 /DNA_START=311 /DNA_END=2041 /DNA_ORIENTATION=+
MTVIEEKIIDTFLKDEELFKYVERKVTKRLPPGPYLKSDTNWYKQVIDLTIIEAFDDLQVKETLNYQILQLEKYLKKKSIDKKAIADHGDANIDDTETEKKNGNNENENLNPNFSFSEPIQQQPKQKRISKIKLINHQNQNHQNDAYITNKKNEKSDLIINKPESELEERVISTDKTPSTDSSKKLKDGVNILNDLDTLRKVNNLVYPDTQISDYAGDSYPDTRNTDNGSNPDIRNTGNGSNMDIQISDYAGDSLVETRTSIENDLPLMLESTDAGSPITSPRGLGSSRYAKVQTSISGEISERSTDSYPIEDEIDIRDVIIRSRSSLTPSKGLSKPPNYPEEGNEVDLNEEIVFHEPIECSSVDLNSLAGSQVDSVVTGELTATDSDEEIDVSRQDIIENIERENDNINDNDSPGNYDESRDEKVPIEIEISVEEEYEFDFDGKEASPVQKEPSLCDLLDDKIANDKIAKNTMFSSWSMPSDNVTRVHFDQEVVSDVFFIREKYSRYEVPELFYTHDESIQFTSDYNRESIKAEALGMTWSEWWELRTDADVLKDSEEDLYESNWNDDETDPDSDQ